MARFELAHKITSSIEKGWANDPCDNGGETYAGIARNFHPKWEGWKIIDSFKANMKLKHGQYIPNFELDEMVEDFYKEKYWDVNHLDEIEDQDVANELFDTGVNMGTGIAAAFLQEALNLLNRNQRDFNDLTVDGKIGKITLSVVNLFPHQKALLKTLNGLQFCRYKSICERNPEQEKFFRGWLLRV